MGKHSHALVGLLVVAVLLLGSFYFVTSAEAACWECSTSPCPGFPVPSGCKITGKCGTANFIETCCTDYCITQINSCYCNDHSKYYSCTGWDNCTLCWFDRTAYCNQCG
jgi:hypothetical protein